MSGAPRVRANKYLDRVLVHMLAGQAEKHYEDRAGELAAVLIVVPVRSTL